MKMPVLKQFVPNCPRIQVFNPNVSPANLFDDSTHRYMEEYRKKLEKEKNSL